MSQFEAFWGKARGAWRNEPSWHPLWMHSLDVAAVGREFAQQRPRLLARIADSLGWPVEEFHKLWVFLLALHDIGKFAEDFQAKAEPWPADVLGPRETYRSAIYDSGHPAAADALLFTRGSKFEARIAGWFPDWGGDSEKVESLLAPIFGHHGRPVSRDGRLLEDTFRAPAQAAALAFADAMHALLRPPVLLEPKAPALRRATWALAGLTTIADWVGSNRDWFPYRENGPTPEAYWHEHALPQAQRALVQAGLLPTCAAPVMGFRALTSITEAPSAVQNWAETVSLPDGPLLILIEDMTGGGKTEAAVMLAHRLMASGRAGGIYFALPTMATANAMFTRMEEVAGRLYDSDWRPTLALAHGHADLHAKFRALRLTSEFSYQPALDTDDEEDSAKVAPQWLFSESRKALLADLGVGTIDQALLGVLPAKYQALRLAGLAEKVLLVDEAHAYDAYMGCELERLIAFQAALGGSTIVLSATLPKTIKERLAQAWSKAVRTSPPIFESASYPCTTMLARGQTPMEEAKAARTDLKRVLQVVRLPNAESAVMRIVEAAQAGAAVAWVRNTVDDVIEGAALLRDRGIEAQIFHARFAMGDRLKIEEDVVKRFGKRGTESERRGRVLVASQVAEQSLDLDMDLLVSDLAPIDLLLQRAGRLWRHMVRTRPIAGPTLLVVSPDPNEQPGDKWYVQAFPRAANVYDHPRVLWATAQEIFSRGALRIPGDVRHVIETVYGPDAESNAPAAFERSSNNAIGNASAERSFAEQNLLKVESGYQLDGTPWLSETKVGTRLAEETRTLRLALEHGGALRPWHSDADARIGWALSEVRVYDRKLQGRYHPLARYRAAADAVRTTWGKFAQDVISLPLERTRNGWTGTLVNENGMELVLNYSTTDGLRFD